MYRHRSFSHSLLSPTLLIDIYFVFAFSLCVLCFVWARYLMRELEASSREREKEMEKETLYSISQRGWVCLSVGPSFGRREREQSCEIPHMLLVVCMMPLQSPEGKGGGWAGDEGRRHKHTFIQMESLSLSLSLEFLCIFASCWSPFLQMGGEKEEEEDSAV